MEKGRCRIVLQITFATLSIHSHSVASPCLNISVTSKAWGAPEVPKKNVMKEIRDLAKTCIYIFVKFQIKTWSWHSNKIEKSDLAEPFSATRGLQAFGPV